MYYHLSHNMEKYHEYVTMRFSIVPVIPGGVGQRLSIVYGY